MLDKLWGFIVRVWYAFGALVAGVVGFILLLLLLLTGLGVLLWQIVHWFKSREWPPVPVSDVLPYFGVHYSSEVPWSDLSGIQKLTNVFLNMPLSLVSFFVFWFLSGDWLRKYLYNVLWPPKHRP
jgi:hypothetical protein